MVETTQKFRCLTADEISQLTARKCSCNDWSKVRVAESFNTSTLRAVILQGEVQLGEFNGMINFGGSVQRPSGISNVEIHNCRIGNNVYINRVRGYIANYVIEDNAVIENVDVITVDGETSFGNGTKAAVLSESGGREIPIYDRLSAHIAYIIAMYRHRPKLIEKLQAMIADYTKKVSSKTGLIARNCRILNCRTIKNVKAGPFTVIDGAERLENGSINSTEEDPVYIGPAVIAKNFIVCSGSRISDGTIIGQCFIGQGCELSKQYSAEHSVFFANCGGFHGEACAIFAGPYTVTHHKSTLLIAGLFSFLNAGSGSNQSNHMYKLGPVHQGVIERGSKTTSDSYILWPAKVGAFTVIMGRHYRNSDTSDLPFSYLIENEDESILVPGVNLRSVGTIRDARKWPRRDNRKGSDKLDCVNFNLLSPYTIEKMINGIELLKDLKKTSGQSSEYFTYHSVKIKNSSLDNGIKFYQMGIDKFLGNSVIKRLEDIKFDNDEQIRDRLRPDTKTGCGKWTDMAGLFAPQQAVEELLDDIETGRTGTLDKVSCAFNAMHDNYYNYEWTWAESLLASQLGKDTCEITAYDIKQMVERWKSSVVTLDNLLARDAMKEFSDTAQTGFGIDGTEEVRQDDFKAVRGSYTDNSFVREIEEHIAKKTALGDELLKRIEKLL